MTTKEITFSVQIDENNLPNKIEWSTGEPGERSECSSVMIALWDAKENNTLRIDLWTKDMMVDEMKKFYHQNVITLTDAYLRATGDDATATKVKQMFLEIGKTNGVIG
jgi:gliding motility-associated protein GldC